MEWINQDVKVFLRYYMNYQQDDWTEWLVAVKFQYNDKRHTATGKILFELNFGQYPWKENLTVKTELPKLEDFLNRLQRSWKKAKKLMEIEKEAMKRQFDKKRRNLQRLKAGDNMWLEAKNIHLNRPSKKLDQKRYRLFRISKDISQGAFQLELPKGWMIYNVFNKDLLTKCKEPQFKNQHIEPALLLDIVNKDKEYKVEEIRNHRKQGCDMQFLVHWMLQTQDLRVGQE